MRVLGGVALSFGTIAVDRATDFNLVPQSLTGGPAAALQILSTVASSMVTLTAPADRIPVLDRQLELLEGLTQQAHPERRDATQALQADAQGIGVSP